jgi:hypothetical protein
MKNTALTLAYDAELYAARYLIHGGDLDQAFKKLETAHVLGQRHVLRHVQTHWFMLKIGYRRNSAREMSGQLLRIMLGAIGSSIGIVPTGNTGGTNVGMFKRMPIAAELKKLLR